MCHYVPNVFYYYYYYLTIILLLLYYYYIIIVVIIITLSSGDNGEVQLFSESVRNLISFLLHTTNQHNFIAFHSF